MVGLIGQHTVRYQETRRILILYQTSTAKSQVQTWFTSF